MPFILEYGDQSAVVDFGLVVLIYWTVREPGGSAFLWWWVLARNQFIRQRADPDNEGREKGLKLTKLEAGRETHKCKKSCQLNQPPNQQPPFCFVEPIKLAHAPAINH